MAVKYNLKDEFSTITFDKVYVIVGRARNRYHDINRCIQCDYYSTRPYINSYMGYRSDKVVVFTSKNQAKNFLRNFLDSKRRRMQYEIDWEIIEYKPYGRKSYAIEYTLIEKKFSEYGWFYTPRIDKCKKIHNELVSISTSIEEISKPIETKTNLSILENKLAELDSLVLDVRCLLDDTKKEEVLSQQDAIAKVKDLIMKYDIRVCDVYDDSEIIDYVQNNFYPEDIVEVECYPDYFWR